MNIKKSIAATMVFNPLYTVLCWTSLFVILGEFGLFCVFYSIFDAKSVSKQCRPTSNAMTLLQVSSKNGLKVSQTLKISNLTTSSNTDGN